MQYNKMAVALALIGIAGTSQAVEIRYELWDASQKPAYQACANDFQKLNPGIQVKIEQKGWDDYWTAITTGFIAGTAPDVFTDHLAKFPEFSANKQLVDLTPLIARDKVATNIYYPGLFKAWGHGSQQFGLPKDWDTIALVFNADMLKAQGIDPKSLQNLTWNPKDGGSFGKLIAQLTVDQNGNNGLSPKFDAKHVKVFGYQVPGPGGMTGQTEWSHFAVSNGFKFNDGPWSTKYYYDDPKLASTLQWISTLPKKGYSASFQDVSKLGADALFASGKVAMVAGGSWMINWYKDNAKFHVGFAPLPAGPQGRATMFNGLADSIWIGSKHKEEAWKWVKYLASPACQNVVGKFGVVFPATPQATQLSMQAHKAQGVDASAFVEMTKAHTFLPPISNDASKIDRIMKTSIEKIFYGSEAAAPALKEANAEVNGMLKK